MSAINTASVYNTWKKELEDQIKVLESNVANFKDELTVLNAKLQVLRTAEFRIQREEAQKAFNKSEVEPVEERIKELYTLIQDAEENSELGRKRLILQTLTSMHR